VIFFTEYFIYILDLSLVGVLVWLLILRRGMQTRNSELKKEMARREAAEKDLAEKEKNLSRLLDSIGEGIGIVDENEIFIYSNKAAEIIFETEEGSLTGRKVSEFLNSEESSKISQGTNNRKKGYSDRYELNIVTEKGNVKVIEITASPSFSDDGKFLSTYGVFRDITEFKNAQIRLKENEELFRTLLNNAPLPIFYKNSNGKYVGCNGEFEKFSGLSESQIIGKSVYEIAPKEIADRYSEADAELLKNGGSQVYEWKVMSSGGELKDVFFHKAALYDYFGNITGLIGAITDVTEIKKYENILKKQQAELERSNLDLEQFAYTVSHDLQEPLRMVSGFTDLLKKKYGDSLNEEALKYIDFAVDGAKRMQDMIQGLLAYSRVSTQANPFDTVSLNNVLETALKNLSAAIKESSAEIVRGDLPAVTGDRSQLISVFQNLIGNAVKFRRDGAAPHIIVGAEKAGDDGKVLITVEDNGIGIDNRHFGSIFMMFHRLHSAEKYAGTGIGLPVCKKIIERHGGEIAIESEKGKGTKFMFKLNKADGV
jgi:PAS domain S-box-containing protein